jgi:hypothetical protein
MDLVNANDGVCRDDFIGEVDRLREEDVADRLVGAIGQPLGLARELLQLQEGIRSRRPGSLRIRGCEMESYVIMNRVRDLKFGVRGGC